LPFGEIIKHNPFSQPQEQKMAFINGHPKGLKSLFFTEMWERLGFYLMLGILYLYITDTERGGLGLSNSMAGEIYGTYLAFVYFTPFLGGMIADKILGFRRSVLFGGILMAAGYFALGIKSDVTFYSGLVLLCLGNGLFKPNISAMVGNLYDHDDPRRDAGFNIFYMGINIGATISALVAAPLRNLWSFNMAFTAAGVGLLVGCAILVFNWKRLGRADIMSEASKDDVSFKQIIMTILLPAGIFGAAGYFIGNQIDFITNSIGPITFGFIIGMLPIMAYFGLLVKKSSPEEKPGMASLIPVYIAGGAFFMVLHLSGGLITVFAEHNTDRQAEWVPAPQYYGQPAMPSYYSNAAEDVARPDERTLFVVDGNTESMFGSRTLTETAVNNLPVGVTATTGDTDFGFLACGVYRDDLVSISTDTDAHGVSTTSVKVPEGTDSIKDVVLVNGDYPALLVSQETHTAVYDGAGEERLPPNKFLTLLNAEMITGLLNPVFVVILTPLVVGFFSWRANRNKAVTTARKIFYGMLITAASIGIMAFAAHLGDNGSAKTSMVWLFAYYLIITVGELCLSPMGLSLVTKLSPPRLVGLMMGGWFLATSVGNKLAGFISGLEPTVGMFVVLAIAILGVAGFIFAMLPRLDSAIKKYGA